MTPILTEAEVRWLDSIRDGHGPSGDIDPHSIRELVRIARRLAVVTDEEQARRDYVSDHSIAEQLDRVAAFYRTPRHRRSAEAAKTLSYTVRSLMREFINGWAA